MIKRSRIEGLYKQVLEAHPELVNYGDIIFEIIYESVNTGYTLAMSDNIARLQDFQRSLLKKEDVK